MPQSNDAELVRVYTRNNGGYIADYSPTISVAPYRFDLVVEAESGTVRYNSGAPYIIAISAFDLTAGASATALSAEFTKSINLFFREYPADVNGPGASAAAIAATEIAWPAYRQRFTIQLTAANAPNAVGHVFKYTVVFRTPPGVGDPVLSIAQSPLFILV